MKNNTLTIIYTNENDGYKGINYAEVSAVIVEAMKEQQKIIEELKTENNLLKAEQITHSNDIRQMREEIKRIIAGMEKSEALSGTQAGKMSVEKLQPPLP